MCYFTYYNVLVYFIVGKQNLEVEEAQPIFDCCKEANIEDSCLYHCDFSSDKRLSLGYQDAKTSLHDIEKCIRYEHRIVVCMQKG